MINLIHKKGEERILFFWMFLIWGIISVIIFVGISLFYGGEADMRILQSEALADRIGDCIILDGTIKNVDDFFSDCNLNEDLFSNGKLFFKVSIFEIDTNKLVGEHVVGERDIEYQCLLRQDQDERRSNNFARCSEKRFYALKDGRSIVARIYAGSNNMGGKF
ncbi:MAG: hypothetical protein QW727_02535 [Candidatus Pacearchaeota archaeon]